MEKLLWLFLILFGANQITVFAGRFGGTSQCCKAKNDDGNNDFDDKMTSLAKECRQEMNIGKYSFKKSIIPLVVPQTIFLFRRPKIGGRTTVLHFGVHWKEIERCK